MKFLLTDILFPNKYAKWRLVEIRSFIDKYDVDILVIDKIEEHATIRYSFDYEDLLNEFKLNEYNICIYNPKYNYINKYNNNFDGTKYNNLLRCSYLFRNKKNVGEFNINEYDHVYHIFLMNYIKFNNLFNFPQHKQTIHLYPGGGLLKENDVKMIKNDVKIISAQHFITKFLQRNGYNNILNLYGGPFFNKFDIITTKKRSSEFTICFTSLGGIFEKGANIYLEIVKIFLNRFPNMNVNFMSIGNCPYHPNIKKYDPMSQTELSKFYFDNVDVYINLDTGTALNGFPLGVEAAVEGCFLLTTDVYDSNTQNNFNFDECFIININDIKQIVDKIKYLYDNRSYMYNKSIELQRRIYELFNYDNYMKKIFNFIEK